MCRDVLFCDKVLVIQKQFFNLVPTKTLEFTEVFTNVEDSCAEQDVLLNLTIGNKLVKEYPVKREYQLSFLKALILWLESNNSEVSENVYTSYCDLLTPVTADNEATHFRHYLLGVDSAETLVIKESATLISQGTTGLCSWQAALALAEWCCTRKELICDKRVLELGSGVGLTGLAVSLKCLPKSYWFSDCHPGVLDLLKYNVRLNIELSDKIPLDSKSDTTKNSCNSEVNIPWEILHSDKVKNTEIAVLKLPWEEVHETNLSSDTGPDIVLAADVVYDSRVSPVLVRALKHLILSRQCTVLMACTVRNPETLDQFFILLAKEITKLDVTEEQVTAEPKILNYSADSNIKIYKIRVQN